MNSLHCLRFLYLSSVIFVITGCNALVPEKPKDPSAPLPPIMSATQGEQISTTTTTPTQKLNLVTLLVPLQGNLASAGQAVRDGFLAAYNQTHANIRPTQVNVIDTSNSSNVQNVYAEAVQKGTDFVVGPLAKLQVQTIAQSHDLSVPTLSLNYLDTNQSTPTQLYQFGLSPFDEARQAAELAWQNNHKTALIIAPAGNWGNSVVIAFQDKWQSLGGTVQDTLFFSGTNQALTTQLRNFLQFKQPNKKSTAQRRRDFDVIFLVASPESARQIRPLLKFYYAGNIPVYATALVYGGKPQPQLDNDLNDIIFCDAPFALKNTASANSKLYALGSDAYQIVTQFNRLAASPQETIQGATGMLSINEQHRVTRQLPCAQFRNGTPYLLTHNNDKKPLDDKSG